MPLTLAAGATMIGKSIVVTIVKRLELQPTERPPR
jgi:hypothetical protein